MPDLTNLYAALMKLDGAMAVSKNSTLLAAGGDDLRDTVIAGVIKHFEAAFELSWKALQRWLDENGVGTETDARPTRKDLFRLGSLHGVVGDPSAWFRYNDARNLTSHTYRRATADDVYALIDGFLGDAWSLYHKLEGEGGSASA